VGGEKGKCLERERERGGDRRLGGRKKTMANERRSGESRGRHGLNGTSTSTGPTWHGILLLLAGENGSARGQHAVDEILSVSAVERALRTRSLV
jgi:hypothetical protein